MSKTLGPVIAMGGITVVNQSVLNGEPLDWRIPLATGLAAVGFSLVERVSPLGAEILAWTALMSVLLTRMPPKYLPSPTESIIKWFDNVGKES